MSIILDHVSYIYGEDGPLAVKALDDVSLQIPDGQFVGIIGHTGSGNYRDERFREIHSGTAYERPAESHRRPYLFQRGGHL